MNARATCSARSSGQAATIVPRPRRRSSRSRRVAMTACRSASTSSRSPGRRSRRAPRRAGSRATARRAASGSGIWCRSKSRLAGWVLGVQRSHAASVAKGSGPPSIPLSPMTSDAADRLRARRRLLRPRRLTCTRPRASSPTWSAGTTRPSTPGRHAAVEKQHAKGKLTARERIELLLDQGSFVEFDELARHRSHDFGMDDNRPYGDGVVTGYGTDRRPARSACSARTSRSSAARSARSTARRSCKVMDLAHEDRLPGHRHQRRRRRAHPGGRRRARPVRARSSAATCIASGVIPQISLIMGPCAGGAVYSPAITDFIVMVDQTSHMFITGPDVIKTVTGEDVTMEELGGAPHPQHASPASPTTWPRDEDDAIDYVQALLSYPARRTTSTSRRWSTTQVADRRGRPTTTWRSTRSSPTRRTSPTTCTRSSSTSSTTASSSRCTPLFAPNIVIGFGRVEGQPVGVVANQPMQFAGTPRHRRLGEGRPVRAHLRRVQHPDADLRRRARLPARHRPGVERHHPPRRQAALRLRRGDRAAWSPSSPARPTAAPTTSWAPSTSAPTSTSPGRPRRSRSWAPRARSNILYRKELAARRRPGRAPRAELVTEYEDTLANPYIAAERGYVDAVIPPSRDPRPRSSGRCAPCAPSARPCRPRSTGTSRCERGAARCGAGGRASEDAAELARTRQG